MTILVIEDNRVLRLATERMLIKAGYSVIAVGDGQEGLLRAAEVCPDLILLDMMLPTIDGTVVLRELKSNPRTKSIPVIVVSGLSQRNEDKLVKSGAAAYLEKSALLSDGDGNRLAQVVQRLVNERLGGTEERTLGDAR
jgi:two-component system cell cycle response regulator DivK